MASDAKLDLERERILSLYTRTRARTEELAARLSPEDQQLQSMPDASPTKWHRAHTTWFFEAFVLGPAGVPPYDPAYAFLFNSYYEAVGARHPRPKRGLLSRPSAVEVGTYRRRVDEELVRALANASAGVLQSALPVVELGIAHEEQHQELILTDVLSAFAESALEPVYAPLLAASAPGVERSPSFRRFEGGLHEVGAREGEGFFFDNEGPRHKVWIEPFELADRLVTARELRAFIDGGGYATPSLWLSEGFDFVRAHGLSAPLYTSLRDGALTAFTLHGRRVLGDDEPACHLSFYEADAIARFLGARLPTEDEWELAASRAPSAPGAFADDDRHCPAPARFEEASAAAQLFGDVWEWTSSSYEPYPGYRAPEGALGEYNGKFMISQKVLRGGSCLTPRRHIRASYRNFWHPSTRFQMSGLRLARDV